MQISVQALVELRPVIIFYDEFISKKLSNNKRIIVAGIEPETCDSSLHAFLINLEFILSHLNRLNSYHYTNIWYFFNTKLTFV